LGRACSAFRGIPDAEAKRGIFGIRRGMLTGIPSTADRRFEALGVARHRVMNVVPKEREALNG